VKSDLSAYRPSAVAGAAEMRLPWKRRLMTLMMLQAAASQAHSHQ